MYKLTVAAVVICGTLLASCNFNKMSPEEAIAYQADQLIKSARILYMDEPSIPDGELTKNIVLARMVYRTDDDSLKEQSFETIRNNDAIHLISPDYAENVIRNSYGGLVRIMSQAGKITVVYTKVPPDVDCSGIKNVRCFHEKS
ncbi:hypothetical protein [Methylophilus sp. QUAN]|uniref:hypothetical protein n=1 Tax=Methylophilus sp. QUAN TaxID=2781020 RepID=UPI0018907813|nr:hypothetical protein [Methylophilus sp. QUAN]MBF4991119.1 hypothetical protein [Methylophilus sp. QUAN]